MDPGALGALQEVVGNLYLPLGAVGDERRQEVLLIPVESLLDPVSWKVERQEDVVDVDPDSGLQTGQHPKEEVNDIGTGLHDVGAVDEEHVPIAQLVEGLHLDILREPPVEGHERQASLEEGTRIRFDAEHARIPVPLRSAGGEQGRKPPPTSMTRFGRKCRRRE
jgi:hypothetical protein